MAKSAKKKQKSEAQAESQHRHNSTTKHSNSKNRPLIWESSRNEDGTVNTVEYDSKTQWDWSLIYDAATDNNGVTRLVRKKREKQQPLQQPYDTLLDDWEEGIRAYALAWDARIDRVQLENGRYRYTVFQKAGKNIHVFLTVESPKNIHFGGRKKFRKRRN